MTQPPDLDEATKLRIEQEEAYRARLRAGENAPSVAPAGPVPPVAAPKKKRGCGFWILIGLGIIVVLAVIGSLAPKSSQPATNAASGAAPAPTASSSSAPEPVATPPASDGSQSVGVWRLSNVSWNTARTLGGQFGESAGEGETFVTVRFTLNNVSKETQSFSSMIDKPELVLKDGSLIDADTMLSIQAGGQMIDGQIAPGLRRTGTYAFRVPSTQTTGMVFQVQFIGGERVTFGLTQ